MGVHAQRKGNPSDHRRGERQEAGRQAGQQLNWPHTDSLTPGFQINCYLQNISLVLLCFIHYSVETVFHKIRGLSEMTSEREEVNFVERKCIISS